MARIQNVRKADQRKILFNDATFSLISSSADYVKSNTVVGDSKHTTGVVLAEIVMGNIPVKNGVVHLIHRPLMVVDTTVAKFLEVRRTANLKSIFSQTDLSSSSSFFLKQNDLGSVMFLKRKLNSLL